MIHIITNRCICIVLTSVFMLSCVTDGKAGESLADTSTSKDSKQTQPLLVLAADAKKAPARSILNRHSLKKSKAWGSGTYEIVEIESFSIDSRAMLACETIQKIIMDLELQIIDQRSRKNQRIVKELRHIKQGHEQLLRAWQRVAKSELVVFRLWNGKEFVSMEGRRTLRDPVNEIKAGLTVAIDSKREQLHAYQFNFSELVSDHEFWKIYRSKSPPVRITTQKAGHVLVTASPMHSYEVGEIIPNAINRHTLALKTIHSSKPFTRVVDMRVVPRPAYWKDHGDPPLEWNSWIDTRGRTRSIDVQPDHIRGATWKITIPTPKHRTWVDVYRKNSNGARKSKLNTFAIEPDTKALRASNKGQVDFIFYPGESSRNGFDAELAGTEFVEKPTENMIITHDASRITRQSPNEQSDEPDIKAVQEKPEDHDSPNEADVQGDLLYASSLTKQRKSREAIRLLKKLMRDNSESFTKAQLYQINSLFEQLQRKPEAIDAATLLIKKYPDSPEAKLFKQLYKL